MLDAKLHFRTLLSENCNVLLRQIAVEPTKCGCRPNKLDQRLVWKLLPIVVVLVAFSISGMLQSDALQIGILLKEHPVCSMIMVRGIVVSFLLLKLAVLLTVCSDWGRFIAKIHSKGIKMNLAEAGHAVVNPEFIWLHQTEIASAIDYLCSATKGTDSQIVKGISWRVEKSEVSSSHGKRTNV
jgi:hypothetical protein